LLQRGARVQRPLHGGIEVGHGEVQVHRAPVALVVAPLDRAGRITYS
jgi:hypothetical protein